MGTGPVAVIKVWLFPTCGEIGQIHILAKIKMRGDPTEGAETGAFDSFPTFVRCDYVITGFNFAPERAAAHSVSGTFHTQVVDKDSNDMAAGRQLQGQFIEFRVCFVAPYRSPVEKTAVDVEIVISVGKYAYFAGAAAVGKGPPEQNSYRWLSL